MADKELIVRPKRVKGEDGYKTFSIRVKEQLVTRVDEIAERTNRSRNELIGLFLQYALDHCVIQEEDTSPGA